MTDTPLLRQTLVWIGSLLGISVVWVAFVSLTSLLIVSRALPDDSQRESSPRSATPAGKPASSGAPQKVSPTTTEESPLKRRNG